MGNHYAMKVYPVQHHDAHLVHRPQEVRIFPGSNQQNQTSTVALGTTVLQSHLAPTGQNMVGSTIKPKPFRVVAPVAFLPPTGSIVGTTDLRYVSLQYYHICYSNKKTTKDTESNVSFYKDMEKLNWNWSFVGVLPNPLGHLLSWPSFMLVQWVFIMILLLRR